METKVLDQNELVQLLPRQFSAIDFVQLVGEQSTFTPDQVASIKRQAESMALPGKVVLWDAVETACGLLAANSMKHIPFCRTYSFPEEAIAKFILVVKVADARPVFELSSGVLHRRIDHEIQHLAIPESEARKFAQNFLQGVRDVVKEEEERRERMASYKPWTSVEELIPLMPRELTIGKFMELIQDRKRFSPDEIEALIQESANWADQ